MDIHHIIHLIEIALRNTFVYSAHKVLRNNKGVVDYKLLRKFMHVYQFRFQFLSTFDNYERNINKAFESNRLHSHITYKMFKRRIRPEFILLLRRYRNEFNLHVFERSFSQVFLGKIISEFGINPEVLKERKEKEELEKQRKIFLKEQKQHKKAA
ncbi:MAG: hypothetical protein AB7V77_00070 [Candidatus Woesearchaeota archaeon]